MKSLGRMNLLAGAQRPWPGVAAAALGCVLVAGLAASAASLDARARADARAAAALVAAQQPAPRVMNEAERLRVAQLRSVAGELGAPWADLLAAFETHGGRDVGLLKLEPDAKSGVVRLTAQARDDQALFAYVRALETDARLRDVLLTTHQVEREVPGQPLRFSIQAGWRRAGAVAPAAAREVP